MLIKKNSKKYLNGFNVPNRFFYWTFLAGFLGGKILCYLEKPLYYFNNPSTILSTLFDGGFVCYGSIIFIILYVVYFAKKNSISVYGFLDVVVVGGIIAQITGRLGCYFGGCCYGKSTNILTGIIFPSSNNIPVHPTQLYESLLLFFLFIILFNTLKKQNSFGKVSLTYLLSYAFIRFLLEFIRGDYRGFLFHNLLSHSQVIALFTIILVSLLLIKQQLNFKQLKNQKL